MPRNLELSSESKNSKLISWQTVANLYNKIPLGICQCETIDDAKGYTKVLILIVVTFLLAGLEGGAV